jgi:hypothetical protein
MRKFAKIRKQMIYLYKSNAGLYVKRDKAAINVQG